jgi:FtsP/CotA-like multicopper oxidase with cupredoxin domain
MNEKVESTINAGSTSAGRIRFRFVNMSAFATMIIYLSGGMRMTVIEIDGTPLDSGTLPWNAKAIELNAGQRISIVVDPKDNGYKNFNIYSTVGMIKSNEIGRTY